MNFPPNPFLTSKQKRKGLFSDAFSRNFSFGNTIPDVRPEYYRKFNQMKHIATEFNKGNSPNYPPKLSTR